MVNQKEPPTLYMPFQQKDARVSQSAVGEYAQTKPTEGNDNVFTKDVASTSLGSHMAIR